LGEVSTPLFVKKALSGDGRGLVGLVGHFDATFVVIDGFHRILVFFDE
jgi:hypothetical protein